MCVCVFSKIDYFFTFLTNLDVFPSFSCVVVLDGAFKTAMNDISEMSIVILFLMLEAMLLIFAIEYNVDWKSLPLGHSEFFFYS